MKIIVAAFGKLKAPGLREAADYYVRLGQSFNELEEIELKPSPLPDKSAASRVKAQTQDGEILQSTLEKRTGSRRRVVLLDEKGPAKPTLGWAKIVQTAQDQGVSELVFCVGSSMGFSDHVRKEAHAVLGFGAQTLPHELARVVLLEQIYRALAVLKNHPYHNEG